MESTAYAGLRPRFGLTFQNEQKVTDFAVVEEIGHDSRDEHGNALAHKERKFDYIASILFEPETGVLAVEECRGNLEHRAIKVRAPAYTSAGAHWWEQHCCAYGFLKVQRALSLAGLNFVNVGVPAPMALRATGSMELGTALGMIRYVPSVN